MRAPEDLLLPTPRSVRLREGRLHLLEHCQIVASAVSEWAAEGLHRNLSALGLHPSIGAGGISAQLRLALDPEEPLGPQGYRLTIESDGVDLVSAGAPGLNRWPARMRAFAAH